MLLALLGLLLVSHRREGRLVPLQTQFLSVEKIHYHDKAMLESHTSLTGTTLDRLYQQDQEWRIRRSYARASRYFSLYDIRHNVDTDVEESIRH
jgi:hypothetical protein